MGNTTHLRGNSGALPAGLVYGKFGGNTLPAKYVYVQSGGAPVGIYSVLSASAADVSNTTASGESSSGTATTGTPGLSVGGNVGSLGYSWTRTGGDTSCICDAPTSANPTFHRDFSSVPNGAASGIITANWTCTITDTLTGAVTTVSITSSHQWTNTIPAYGPFTASYVGWSSSGASAAGAGHTITVNWGPLGGTITVPASGGPTSGSYSYAWSRTSGDSTIACSNTAIISPTFSQSSSTFFVTQQDTSTDSAIWNCRITDTVSGYYYDLTVTPQYTFTNNTG